MPLFFFMDVCACGDGCLGGGGGACVFVGGGGCGGEGV